MPIVRTKKAIEQLESGQVLELLATDPGSHADIQGWAKSTGHQYLGTHKEGDVLKHYIRKANASETKAETKHPHVVSNEDLEKKLQETNDVVVLDVREPAEYAFGHIPGATSIPLGELEEKLPNVDKNKEIYVVCRTGTRSDLAAQQLSKKGFNVINVVPGMSEWNGPVEKLEK